MLVTLFPVPAFTQPQQPSQYYSGWRNSPPNAIHVASTGALPKSMTLLTSLEGLYLCVDISTSRIESILSYLAYILGYYSFLPVYPELTALVGSRLPDYRGIFLRGHGSQVSTHYGTVIHASAGLGELQGDAIREIWADMSEQIAMGSSEIISGAMYYGIPHATGAHPRGSSSDWMKRGANFYASRITPVADEIRPVNRSVKYLIRAK